MRMKWAVIGSAGIAKRRTIPEGIAAADNAALTAVYDVDDAANRAVAEHFGAQACASEAELLAADADIVYVATPAYLHCEQVERAAQAGKHVFCEKPLGMTVAEGERMLAICRENNVALGTGFMMRFHAQHRVARELLQSGKLGTPVFGRAQLSCWYPPIPGAWRQDPALGGGGSLMDLGGHCIDLLEMFFGPATSVFCMTDRRVQSYASEDTAVVLLEFASGAKGVVDCLFNVPDASSKNRLELYCAQGGILAEGTIGQGELGTMTAYIEAADAAYDAQQARDASGGIVISPTPVNMYRAEVEAFSRAVAEQTAPPVDGEAGLWSQKVLTACYESAKMGTKIAFTA